MDLEFIKLLESLKDEPAAECPRPGFASAVMRSIKAGGGKISYSLLSRAAELLRFAAAPARAAAIAAVAAAAAAIFALLPPSSDGRAKEVLFRVELPGASAVSVTGDFNGWDMPGLKLVSDKKGVWSAGMKIPPGRYRYVFVVDGDFMPDPSAAETVPDGFGNKNAVLDTARPPTRRTI